ncbi:MAG: hypothetical protein R2707_00250 [Acidimicrobiales bacterium]
MEVNESLEAPSPPGSLRSLRVAAAIGALAAFVVVGVGFSFGLVYGIVALIALPAIPLLFVLGFEALRRSS